MKKMKNLARNLKLYSKEIKRIVSQWTERDAAHDRAEKQKNFETSIQNFKAWYELQREIKVPEIELMKEIPRILKEAQFNMKHALYFACLKSERIFLEDKKYVFRSYAYSDDITYMGADFFYYGGRSPLSIIPNIQDWNYILKKSKWYANEKRNTIREFDLSKIYNDENIDEKLFKKVLVSLKLLSEKIGSNSAFEMKHGVLEMNLDKEITFKEVNGKLILEGEDEDFAFNTTPYPENFSAKKFYDYLQKNKEVSLEKMVKHFGEDEMEDFIDGVGYHDEEEYIETLNTFMKEFLKYEKVIIERVKGLNELALLIEEEKAKFSSYLVKSKTFIKLLKK